MKEVYWTQNVRSSSLQLLFETLFYALNIEEVSLDVDLTHEVCIQSIRYFCSIATRC
jgi:hypothetical protein